MKKKPYPTSIGGFSTDGEFFKMDHKQFMEYVGGRLAVALFNGSFQNEVYNAIQFAHARGMLRQWEVTNGYE